MSDHSAIEWTDATWNPVRGCTKVSPGCKLRQEQLVTASDYVGRFGPAANPILNLSGR